MTKQVKKANQSSNNESDLGKLFEIHAGEEISKALGIKTFYNRIEYDLEKDINKFTEIYRSEIYSEVKKSLNSTATFNEKKQKTTFLSLSDSKQQNFTITFPNFQFAGY